MHAYFLGRRKLLMDDNDVIPEGDVNEENCTSPAILHFPKVKFPGDKPGQLIFSLIAAVYFYILLARVCDDYFIYSIKIICSSKYAYEV